MRLSRPLWGASLLGIGACALAPTMALAVGEPRGDYPSHDERVMIYLTNRARSQPEKYNPQEPYPATPPVRWDLKLSEAARFHAEHIIKASCWCEDHSSCCALTSVPGGAQCQGPSTGCGVTDASTRVLMYSPNYSAENMARGQRTPAEAVDGWINSSGHWRNINGGHTMLGVGRYEAAWVQDFGRGGGVPPVAEDGVHFTQGASQVFGITYYQPGTGGPRSILAIINGQCRELELVAGKPEHGAFETSLTLEPGCHRYYFYVRDGRGEDHVYPSTGSFAVNVAGASGCPFFSENRPADSCSPAGQPCQTGDTRACYTGPYGTRDQGICSAGVERCVAGQWAGSCRLEVTPEPVDQCGDDLDNNCDGVVDDGCAPPVSPGEDQGQTTAPDMASTPGGVEPQGQSAQGGCQQAPRGAAPSSPGWLLALGLTLGLGWRRRRPLTTL